MQYQPQLDALLKKKTIKSHLGDNWKILVENKYQIILGNVLPFFLKCDNEVIMLENVYILRRCKLNELFGSVP
jgi:hypothetical protein